MDINIYILNIINLIYDIIFDILNIIDMNDSNFGHEYYRYK